METWIREGGGRLTLRTEEKNGELVAWLAGELDHHSADAVRAGLDNALSRAKAKRLVLDMSAMTFMDSSGIGVVLGRYKKMKERGGSVAVRGLSQKMDRILRLAGLYSVVERE